MNEHVRKQSNGVARRAVHPGSGRRKGRCIPRGGCSTRRRSARLAVILGDRPRERALLIEYLHLIQDAEGCLPAGHLHALAEVLRIPMAEVYEVATFYAHFDVVPDGEPRPAKVTMRVCDSLSCMLAGAEALLLALQSEKMAGRARRARAVHRLVPHRAGGRGGPSSRRSRHAWQGEGARAAGRHARRDARLPGSRRLRAGWRLRRAALVPRRATRKVEDVIATLSDGGLRGLGGAGFPDRPQVGPGAAGEGAAPDGGQRRRGRARHLQGPHLPRDGAAQVPRGHADRGLGGRGRSRSSSTCATNIRPCSRSCETEIAKLEAAGLRKHTRFTSAAAPAPTSAAKKAR